MKVIQQPSSEVVKLLQEKLNHFKRHYFIDKQQSQTFRGMRVNVNETTVIVQVDFAEEFSLKMQDEAQSSYFDQKYAVLFTCCICLKGSTECIVVLSDYQSEDKFAVSYYMMLILLYIKEKHPEINFAEVFSDGAGSQFKNKFTQLNVVYAPEDFRMMVNWNFSCTSHGKVAVDGVGTVVKQSLWSAIESRKYNFQNARDCHNYATEKISGVKTFYAEEDRILAHKEILEERWEKTRPIPHIKSMHSLEFSRPNLLKLRVYRNSNNYKQHSVLKVPPKSAGRLRVLDVYTDSEDDDPAGVSDEILSAEACNSKLAQPTIRLEDLTQGSFVLLQCDRSDRRMKRPSFRVGIYKGDSSTEKHVDISSLAAVNSTKRLFQRTSRIPIVRLDEIIKVLSQPESIEKRNRVLYQLDADVI
ncbi:hypothetical protein QAD02_002548 [Eretmocerus hayati]|uniref:Uncharacterized protein n=1 Tax=Eretmocerus hayati TaxID=131215 RepID=A0ACC2NJ60_9HYME|nr:hypothetical protein QAD02_002548 [Eretmocerus hayati]